MFEVTFCINEAAPIEVMQWMNIILYLNLFYNLPHRLLTHISLRLKPASGQQGGKNIFCWPVGRYQSKAAYVRLAWALTKIRSDRRRQEFEHRAKMHGFTTKYKPTGLNGNELHFKWQRLHQSWSASKREVYFDFGDDKFFCIIEGIGEGKSLGYQISKLEFIRKQGSNEGLIQKVL